MKIDLVSEKILLSSIAASFVLSAPLSVLEPNDKVVIDGSTIVPNERSDYIHKGFNIRSIKHKLLNYDLVTIVDDHLIHPKVHSSIRSYQKFKKIPVDNDFGLETLTALFINKEIAEIEVEDHVLLHIKEGQLISLGDKGTSVIEIQNFLIDAGYYHFEKDAIFGPITKKAVLNYQKDNGLIIDGIVGQQTYEHLAGITATVKVKAKKETPIHVPVYSTIEKLRPTAESFIDSQNQKTEKNDLNQVDLLESGDKGLAVKELQRLLKNKGYYPNQIDGVFGPITEATVRSYQYENNLKADGLAGSVTIKHLKSSASKPLTSRTAYPPVVTEKTADNMTTNEIINYGKKFIGTPYIWGGTTPTGFDCSGFLMYVFKKNGLSIPRTVSEIWSFGKKVQEPKTGDLVFFETYKKGPSHAGIYLGNQKFLHAGSSTGVSIGDLTINYWSSRYLGAKRVN